MDCESPYCIISNGLLEKIPFCDLITEKSSVKKVDEIVFP